VQPGGIGKGESQDRKPDIGAELDDGKEPGVFFEHRKYPPEGDLLYQCTGFIGLLNSSNWNKIGTGRFSGIGETTDSGRLVKERKCGIVRLCCGCF
jgi:hypothetical protein